MANRWAFRPSVIERIDELFAEGGAPPALVVFVDAWTSLGGSRYLDSPGTGKYHTYLCDEVVPGVDARYRTIPKREHRAITGKSSGGYGAMVTPMLRPNLWGGLATHAGDALFENVYLAEFRQVARTLRDDYEGSYDHPRVLPGCSVNRTGILEPLRPGSVGSRNSFDRIFAAAVGLQ